MYTISIFFCRAVIVFIVRGQVTRKHIYILRVLECFENDTNSKMKIVMKTFTDMHSLSLEGPDKKLVMLVLKTV